MDKCYYADPNACQGELWDCQTCGEQFCQSHDHATSLGVNVECVGCERARMDKSASLKKRRPSIDGRTNGPRNSG